MPALYRYARYSTLLLILFLFAAHLTHAATITVTGASASVLADGQCSLIEAITAANTNAAVEECPAGSGADTIVFDSTAFATPQTIYFAPSGSNIMITDSLTITGPGAADLTLSGDGSFQQFVVLTGVNFTFEGLTLTGFRGVGGGAINNAGVLNVSNCVVTGNFALGDGGGIRNSGGTLVVSNSRITGNQAVDDGGGIANDGGTATVVNSTVSNNLLDALNADSGDGAGIWSSGGTLTVTNSVISGNRTNEGQGGGIFSGGTTVAADLSVENSSIKDNFSWGRGGGISGTGTITVLNSTIAGNRGGGGGGIFARSVSVSNSTISGNRTTLPGGAMWVNSGTITNSTIADNSAEITSSTSAIFIQGGPLTVGNTILRSSASGPNLVASSTNSVITSLGHNISSDDGGGFLTAIGDQVNTDPMLGPLQDNGGRTFTHALLTGSPAINEGNNSLIPAGVTTDQRGTGFSRIVGGTVDIGAFEVQPSTTVCPQPQGYWKNNPSEWPVQTGLTIGNKSYTNAELLALLNTPAGTGRNADASLILAYHLIAAKLNAATGANTSSVSATIEAADTLLAGYLARLPLGIRTSSAPGQLMVEYGRILEAFNKGTTTPGCTTGNGTIVIINQAAPETGQVFGFGVTGTGLSAFSLVDDGNDNDATPNRITFSGLATGQYSITQTSRGDYSLISITCSVQGSGGSSASQNVPQSLAAINLVAGDTVTCTFNNALFIIP